ncbi:hypothetical protein QQ045_031058 [Rhodiola kirilowii]
MSDMSDDSGEYMATLSTLDNPIRDEYDRDAMENLDNVADEYPDAEEVQDRIVWDHPSFTDISACEIYQPTDENVRVHHPNSPDLGEGSLFASKENVMLAVQRYSILNRVEFRVRKSDTRKLVLKCLRGDHVCHNNSILQSNIHLNAQFIAREMRNVMDANTKFSAGQIRNIIQRDYGRHAHVREVQCEIIDCNRVRREQRHTAIRLCACGEREHFKLEVVHVLYSGRSDPTGAYGLPSCVRTALGEQLHDKVNDEVLKAQLGDVAYAKKELKFTKKFGELLELLNDQPRVRKWLVDMNKETWTQAYDHGGLRWGNMTTNASECLNKILRNGRDLPVSSLVMYTYKQIAAYFVKRSQRPYHNDGELFPPKICERLAELRARAEFHIVTLYNPVDRVFVVLTRKNHITYRVNLEGRTCSCGKWTLFKYPCSHAIAACRNARVEYSDYVPAEYTLDAYYRTWGYFFNPLPHESFWRAYEGCVHVPNPRFKRTKGGRPPTRRRRNEMDQRHRHLGNGNQKTNSPPSPLRGTVKRKTKRVHRSFDDEEQQQKPPSPTRHTLQSDLSKKSDKKKDILSSFNINPKRKKKRERQLSLDNLDHILNPLIQIPASITMPPPPSVFHNIFSSKKGKTKKSASDPPSITSKGKFTKPNTKIALAQGNESPLYGIPEPPPLPPFGMPVWKFVVEGDYVRLKSMNSSRSVSPDRDDSIRASSSIRSDVDEEASPPQSPAMFFPSPDVNTKADNFIATFRAGLKMEKVNSGKGVGLSRLGPTSNSEQK